MYCFLEKICSYKFINSCVGEKKAVHTICYIHLELKFLWEKMLLEKRKQYTYPDTSQGF